jgi:hypothetical protein
MLLGISVAVVVVIVVVAHENIHIMAVRGEGERLHGHVK